MLLRMLLLGLALVVGIGRSAAYVPFNGTCSVDVGQNKFSIAPDVTFPAPYTLCFKLQANLTCGGAGSGPCCKATSVVATFMLDISEECMYGVDFMSLTLNGKALTDFTTVGDPPDFGTAALLTVPGLKLDAKTLAAKNGAQLCLTLQSSSCGSVDDLKPSRFNVTGWNAALVMTAAAGATGATSTTATPQCCPVTALTPPAPVVCETCWVWDVVGPKGTAASAKYDFLSRNSCPLASLEPEYDQGWPNCCEFEAYWVKVNAFDQLRAQGLVTGFDKPVCNKTSVMLCGTINSASRAQANALIYGDESTLRFYFDNTDDTCPMSLINSDVRLRSVFRNGTLDKTCSPLNTVVKSICYEPTIADNLWGDTTPFPNSTCNATRGITPFAMDAYYDVTYRNGTNDYCVTIGTAAPKPTKSSCSNATVLDKLSFWIWDQEPFDGEGKSDAYLGAYLLTKEGGSSTYNKRTNLTASWGRSGENVLQVGSLGLDVAAVKAKQPKICLVRRNDGQLWMDTVDGLGYLWAALYDKSGKCCPAYYSNRF